MKSKLAYDDLKSQKRLLHSALDNIFDGVVVFGRDSRLLLLNPVAGKLFGKLFVGADFLEWYRAAGFHDPETGDAIPAEEFPFRLPLTTDSAPARRLFFVKNKHQPKGLYLYVGVQPVFGEPPHSAGAVFTLHDETSRIAFERQLKTAKRRAERAMLDAKAASEAKSKLLANVSHELRTPMTTILGYTDTLLGFEQSREEELRTVRIIRKNGRLLLQLINDLLDLSKVESGRMSVRRGWIGLDAVVSEIYHALSYRAAAKNIEFAVEFVGSLPEYIFTDEVRLRQILMNIVGNAIKFTEQGRVLLRVSFRKPMIVFSVADTGCGIEKEAEVHLFEPFVQAENHISEKLPGTGLGLTLAKRLCQMLGGDLQLERSVPGVGSTFSIAVYAGPIDDRQLGDAHHLLRVEEEKASDFRLPRGGLGGRRVLLMEDSDENREMYEIFLKTAGAEVVSAADGQEGLEKAASAPFDIFLVDVRMPKKDGFAVVREMRRRGCSAPLVALTAHAMLEEKRQCESAGFDLVLSKPISADGLIKAVRSILTKRAEAAGPRETRDAISRIQEIVDQFAADAPNRVDAIERAWREEDWDRMQSLLHRLKGTAANCGFSALAAQAECVEDELRADRSPDRMESLLARLVEISSHSAGAVEMSSNRSDESETACPRGGR